MVSAIRSDLQSERVGAAVRALSFWYAVALPFAAIGLLALGTDPTVVLPVLAGNAVTLVVGHDHRLPSGTGARPDTGTKPPSGHPNRDH